MSEPDEAWDAARAAGHISPAPLTPKFWADLKFTGETVDETQLPPPRTQIAERVRAFLSLSDKWPDEEPLWMTGGIVLTWGDLRILADYARINQKDGGGEG